MVQYQVEVAAENSLILYFAERQIAQTNGQIAHQVQIAYLALQSFIGGVLIDLTPSYASILVTFDPIQINHYELQNLIRTALSQTWQDTEAEEKVVELPVYYGEEVGFDLAALAVAKGMSVSELIEIHQAEEYRVFAIGFAPGFAYLGNVDQRIASPRLATPRAIVPKGSVGIADRQTAIYPAQSPGGWNIIGRCPLNMFEASSQPPMPVDVGSKVKFKAIDKTKFLALGGVL